MGLKFVNLDAITIGTGIYVRQNRFTIMVGERGGQGVEKLVPRDMSKRDFWKNVVWGAVSIIVIGALPLIQIIAPVGGGALAGYLQNSGAINGAKVGAIAGVIGAIVLNFLAPPRLFGLLSGGIGEGLYLIAILLGFLVVWVIPSAFGGALGGRIAEKRHRQYQRS